MTKRRRPKVFSKPVRARLERAESTRFREATKAELGRMGWSPGSQRLVERGVWHVGKNTPSISRRVFLQKRAAETTGERLSLEQLAKRRRTGEIAYKTAASAEQAGKQRQTRLDQRETKRRLALIKAATTPPPPFTPAAREPTLQGTRHRGRTYKIAATRPELIDRLTRKIVHKEHIDDGKWHETTDWLRAHNQEELANLFRTSYPASDEGIVL